MTMKWVLTITLESSGEYADASDATETVRRALDHAGLDRGAAPIIDCRREYVAPLPDYVNMAREMKKAFDGDPWQDKGA